MVDISRINTVPRAKRKCKWQIDTVSLLEHQLTDCDPHVDVIPQNRFQNHTAFNFIKWAKTDDQVFIYGIYLC